MINPVPDPIRGNDVLPWAAAVTAICRQVGSLGSPRQLTREGLGGAGAEPLPENRRTRLSHRPFEVVGASGDSKFAIYVPDDAVTIGEDTVTPTGISPIAESDCWYTIDDESQVSENVSTLYLIAYADASATITFALDNQPDPDQADDSEDDEDQPQIIAILPIAHLKTQRIGDDSTIGVVQQQLACHPFTIPTPGGNPDDASLDYNRDGQIELYHFADDEQNLSTGLAERLQADPKTGLLTSDDTSGLMLVGRLDGKVVYLPLCGDGGEDPDDPDDPTGGGECDHDSLGGGVGGVSPDNESPHGGVPAGGVPAGGVPAGGDSHRGDDNCNCF